MFKTILKLSFVTIIYAFLYIVINAFLPYSQGFKELGTSANPKALLFFLFSSAWTCFTIFYIIKHTYYPTVKAIINIVCVMFFVQYFMTQMETLFFGSAFTVLTLKDTVLLMLAGLFPLLGTVPFMIKLFHNDAITQEKIKISLNQLIIKLSIIGFVYMCIYMLFGYFVAWQFEELRLFYSGSTEKLSYFGQMSSIIKTRPIAFPFQILRGILFGIAIIPIRYMISKNKLSFITTNCLIYLCTAVVLIIPNVLFPDTVRMAHLIEKTSSRNISL
jgi:hypothetical protein